MNDGIDTEHCAKCSYSACNGTLGVHCEFILIEGEPRGCEPGKACVKFTTEKVRKNEDQWASNLMPKRKKGNTGESKSSASAALGSRPG